jgi:hypothetical protein
MHYIFIFVISLLIYILSQEKKKFQRKGWEKCSHKNENMCNLSINLLIIKTCCG